MDKLLFVMIVLAINGLVTYFASKYYKRNALRIGVFTSLAMVVIFLFAIYLF